jgi:hypothetical protein
MRQSSPSPNEIALRSRQNPLAPRKRASQRASHPQKSALKSPRSHTSTASMSSYTPTIIEAPEILQQKCPDPEIPVRRSSKVDVIRLPERSSSDARRIIDMSLQGEDASDVSPASKSGSPQQSRDLTPREVSRAPSTTYNVVAPASDEHQRFSFEDSPDTLGRA